MMYRETELQWSGRSVETPVLFPVRNIGKRSSDNTPEYTKTVPDFPTAMVNARAIRNHPKVWRKVKAEDSVREEIDANPDTILFADSGGYDYKGNEVDLSVEETLKIQRRIGADIFGTMDLPLSPESSSEKRQERIQRSVDFALKASDAHHGESLLFASVHGYDAADIRNSIHHLERNGQFNGYALGSLVPIRSNYRRVTRLILAARQATDKHLHVYGLGGMVYLPLLAYLGVDSFDSSSFIRSAGKRRYLIPGFGGEVLRNIAELEYLPCACPVCNSRPLAAIREDRNLLTRHNLWAMAIELRKLRYVHASDQQMEDYLDLRYQGNSVTKRAYETAKTQVRRLA